MTLLQRSLKTRVTLFTLAIFVASIWALAFYASRMLRQDMQRLLGEQQYSIVSVLAADINQELGDRLNALEKVVERLTPAMLGDAATMQRFLEDRPVLQTFFNGGVIAYRTDGTAIADSLPAAGRIGVNYLDIDTVAAALQEGRANIGRPVMGKKLRAPVFGITVPMRDQQGKVIGALSGVVNLGRPGFLDKVTASTYGTTGGYLMVAREYRLVITATDKSRIMETLPPPGVNWLVDRFIQGYEGSGVVVNPRGVEVLSSAKGIPAAGWYLASFLPIAEAFAPIRAMQQRILLSTILLTLLAGSLTWWMLRRQLAPMLATAEKLAAQSVASLPLQALPIMRQDEVGDLIGGFNRLLLTLRQREDALKESEENLAVTLQSIGDAVIATDTVGRVTRMNPMAERLCGWMLADALGRPLSELFRIFNADTREPVANPVQAVIAQGQVVGLTNHTLLLAKDGQEYQIADSAAPIRNAAGEIVGVVLVFSDVTEKHQAEQALRDSEERFRNLYEKAPLAYQSVDAAGNILQVNDAWLKLFGFTHDEAIGRFIGDFLGDSSLKTPGREFPQFLSGGRVDGPIFEIKRKDGSTRLVEVNGRIGYDNQGSFRQTHCILTDITERTRAEAALLASEERWKFALEGAGEGVWDWNVQTGDAVYSRRWKEMLGFAEGEIGNSSTEWSSRVHPEDMPKVMAALQAHIDGETPSAAAEFRMLCKDGRWLWTLGRGMVISRDADGKPLRLIGTNADITERKRIELDLQEREVTFRKLFEDSSDAILLIDGTGVFVECNQSALDLLKMTREQFLLLPPARISPEFQPDGRRSAEASQEMIELAYSKGLHRFDWTCVNAEGGEFVVEVSLMPVAIKGQTMLHTTWRDITERKATADRIERLAFYDPLTDLPNRRLLLDRLEQALASSTRRNRHGALMLLDMDDFKTLNDTLGHDVGDQFLVEVARRLQTSVREGDTVARHGGDEFVVILEDLSEDALAATQAEGVAVKILHAVSQPYLLDLTVREGLKNTRSYHCTSSIGITLFRDNSLSADELMKRADTAMYQAKAGGRNALRFFDPEMQAAVAARAMLDNDLREAVRQGQFCLYYQPQVDSGGNRTGAEALVRWQHPRRGLLPPAEFIPQAEATGPIIPIGHWVLETACAQLVAWETVPGMSDLFVSVNVSARQFRQADFVGQVLAVVGSTGVNPRKLKLELTESLLLENVEDVISKMTALKGAGIGFSLDDFGTGYSSLSYLKRLPLDQLKIDRSFVRDVLTDPNDAAIARTIVALAQSMGLAVIAEGVENASQREFLAANGCMACQGYLFGRPMPVEEFSPRS